MYVIEKKKDLVKNDFALEGYVTHIYFYKCTLYISTHSILLGFIILPFFIHSKKLLHYLGTGTSLYQPTLANIFYDAL